MAPKRKLDACLTVDAGLEKVVKQRCVRTKNEFKHELNTDTDNGASSSEIQMPSKASHDASVMDIGSATSPSDVVGSDANTTTHVPDKILGKQIGELYISEICAGSAKLSKAALDHGFMALAVDHKTTRSGGVPIQVWDLEDPLQLQLSLDFIRTEHGKIAMVWMAPSCALLAVLVNEDYQSSKLKVFVFQGL